MYFKGRRLQISPRDIPLPACAALLKLLATARVIYPGMAAALASDWIPEEDYLMKPNGAGEVRSREPLSHAAAVMLLFIVAASLHSWP